MKTMSKIANAIRSWLKVCFRMSLVARIPMEARLATSPIYAQKRLINISERFFKANKIVNK